MDSTHGSLNLFLARLFICSRNIYWTLTMCLGLQCAVCVEQNGPCAHGIYSKCKNIYIISNCGVPRRAEKVGSCAAEGRVVVRGSEPLTRKWPWAQTGRVRKSSYRSWGVNKSFLGRESYSRHAPWVRRTRTCNKPKESSMVRGHGGGLWERTLESQGEPELGFRLAVNAELCELCELCE